MARILVVDDDETLLEMTRGILEARGHDVVGAHQPQEAFEIARKFAFDLFVLDIMMPEFTGLDLMNAFRILHGLHTPILMLSGQGAMDAVKESLALGATDYVVKPFEPAVFLARVDALLTSRRRKNG